MRRCPLPQSYNHGGTIHDGIVEMEKITRCVQAGRRCFLTRERGGGYRVQQCILVAGIKITGVVLGTKYPGVSNVSTIF